MNSNNINRLSISFITILIFTPPIFSQIPNALESENISQNNQCPVDVEMIDNSKHFLQYGKVKSYFQKLNEREKYNNTFANNNRKKDKKINNTVNCVNNNFAPCKGACNQVKVVCENHPPAPPTSSPIPPSTPSSSNQIGVSSDQKILSPNVTTRTLFTERSNFPCPGSLCVSQGTDGNCELNIGIGVLDPYWNLGGELLQCGKILTIDEWSNFYDKYRNTLIPMLQTIINLPEVKLMSKLDKEALAINLYQALLLSCGLADESLHIRDQFYCLHHKSCREANSAASNFSCFNDPTITQRVLKLLGKLAPKLITHLNKSYCLGLFNLRKSLDIEQCICKATRTPKYSKRKCTDCIDKNSTFTFNSNFCKGILTKNELAEILKTLKKSYRDPNASTHSCEAYQLTYCFEKHCGKENSDIKACLAKEEKNIMACLEN